MSSTILCPQGHAVTPGDPLPGVVACPRCGVVFATGPELAAFTAGMAARPAPRRGRDDEDDDDRPRKRKRRREEEEEDEEDDDEPVNVQKLTRRQRQMSLVRLGLLFHAIKLGLFLAALVFGIITLPLVVFAMLAGGGLMAIILIQITFNLGMTLAPIFGTIGSILCAFAPPKSETRGTIIVSMAFDLLAPLFGLFQLVMIFGWIITDDARVSRLVTYMLYARMSCTLVAWWLFQLYLRKLAFYMRESLLASESLNVIVHLLIATIVTPVVVIASLFIPFVSLGALAWFIYFMITFPIRQFRLIFNVRTRVYEKFLKPPDLD